MPESFGTRLRQRREERQIDLIAISEGTKIKLSLLEGLERGDVSQWPSGIFRRAYIRAYAQMLGLDPDEVFREFLEVHPDPGVAFAPTTAAAAAAEEEAAAKSGATSVRLRTIVDSALGSLSRFRRPSGASGPAVAAPAMDTPSSPGALESGAAERDARAPVGVSEEPGAQDTAREETPAPAVAVAAAAETGSPLEERRVEETVTDVAVAAAPAPSAAPAPLTAIDPPVGLVDEDRLEVVAHLCAEFGRVLDREEIRRLLERSAHALEATGLIVWLWDDTANGLKPVLVHGYSERMLAQVPAVRRDADNATAAAFRDATACEVPATPDTSAAIVVPLLTGEGCAGVLAVELRQGVALSRSRRALTVLIGAAVTHLLERSRRGDKEPEQDGADAPLPRVGPPSRPMKVRRQPVNGATGQ